MLVYVLYHDESFLVHPKDPIWLHYEPFKWWLDGRQLEFPTALTHQNCYWEVGGCLIENATGVNPRRKGKNEETDQIEHTTRTDSSHQTALSSSGSGRQKDDAG
jgi:hypothetical protein